VVAECLKEAHYAGVETEPQLQPLSGESFKLKSANKDDEARSDVKCIGFWTRMRQAYFDIKVVSPYARSYSSLSPPQFFRQAEQSKIREYLDLSQRNKGQKGKSGQTADRTCCC